MEAEPEQQPQEAVPDIEWWDVRICEEGATYDAIAAAAESAGPGDGFAAAVPLLQGKITNLVQHPVPIQPPAEMPPPPPRPLMLTKKVCLSCRRSVASRVHSAGTGAAACCDSPPGMAQGTSAAAGFGHANLWSVRSGDHARGLVVLTACRWQHARSMSHHMMRKLAAATNE